MQAQHAMGNMGLPVLVAALTEDQEDLDMLRGALEVLLATFAVPEQWQQQQQQQGGRQHMEVRWPWGRGGVLMP